MEGQSEYMISGDELMGWIKEDAEFSAGKR